MRIVKTTSHELVSAKRGYHDAARRCLMSALGLVFSLLSCLLLVGQLSFASGQAYAAEQKAPKSKSAASQKTMAVAAPKPCCLPGAPCPAMETDSSPGCKCCGFRVDGKLVEY